MNREKPDAGRRWRIAVAVVLLIGATVMSTWFVSASQSNGLLFAMIMFAPMLAVIVGLAVAAIILLAATSRRPEPHCLKCGYDLRNLATDRCPECGNPAIHGTKPPSATNTSA